MVTQNYNYSVEKQAVVRIFLYASVGKSSSPFLLTNKIE